MDSKKKKLHGDYQARGLIRGIIAQNKTKINWSQ